MSAGDGGGSICHQNSITAHPLGGQPWQWARVTPFSGPTVVSPDPDPEVLTQPWLQEAVESHFLRGHRSCREEQSGASKAGRGHGQRQQGGGRSEMGLDQAAAAGRANINLRHSMPQNAFTWLLHGPPHLPHLNPVQHLYKCFYRDLGHTVHLSSLTCPDTPCT